MCAKEKQFGDALYILNSMRFSVYPPSYKPPPPPSERAAFTWTLKPKRSKLLSSTPSSIGDYTFINFGQPVPTRLASHSFLHSLVKAGLPTKAAAQAELMMADGIRIRTRTMESILASTVDQSSYPPTRSLKVPLSKAPLQLGKYPIADVHTRIAVRLLEEARRRRQERTQQMYDVVINTCLIQGEIIVASLLFIMVIKDWQLRQALKSQRENNPPEPSERLNTTPLFPTRQTYMSLLERIDCTLTTRKDPQDPLFQNAIQALANLAFAVDTGQFPSRFMGSLIKALYSVPKSDAIVHIGSPPEVHAVNAYRYIHKVLMRLVEDAGRKQGEQMHLAAGRKLDLFAFNALLHYCLRHRLSKTHASDLLKVMKRKRRWMTVSPVNVLFRSSTLLRDDTIRTDEGCSLYTPHTNLPLTRWAHVVNVLKLAHAVKYPSEPVIQTPVTPSSYTVTCLITHLTATGRGRIIAEKLAEIIPELSLVGVSLEQCGRRAVAYGPYFFAVVLNALVKNGRTVYAKLVWRLAIEAEKASWVDGNEPWLIPIQAYTCMLQLCSNELRARKVAGAMKRIWSAKRVASAMTMAKAIFRSVQTRCRSSRSAEERDHTHREVPVALRKFTADERYFNALLDFYRKRVLGYAWPMKKPKSYWRWLEGLTSDRFMRDGRTNIRWHPMLARIAAEMHRCGYKVPEGLRFLFVGRRTPGMDTGGSKLSQPARPGPLPVLRQNPLRIPVFKTRGLLVARGKRGKRVRRGD